MWSSVTIPGKPSILVVDASRNLEGWEYEFMDRLFSSLKRSRLVLVRDTPVRIEETHELEPHLSAGFNCILFFSHGEGERGLPDAKMQTHWEWLNIHGQLPPTLFAGCMCRSYDPAASQQVLESPQTFAPLALAPTLPFDAARSRTIPAEVFYRTQPAFSRKYQRQNGLVLLF